MIAPGRAASTHHLAPSLRASGSSQNRTRGRPRSGAFTASNPPNLYNDRTSPQPSYHSQPSHVGVSASQTRDSQASYIHSGNNHAGPSYNVLSNNPRQLQTNLAANQNASAPSQSSNPIPRWRQVDVTSLFISPRGLEPTRYVQTGPGLYAPRQTRRHAIYVNTQEQPNTDQDEHEDTIDSRQSVVSRLTRDPHLLFRGDNALSNRFLSAQRASLSPYDGDNEQPATRVAHLRRAVPEEVSPSPVLETPCDTYAACCICLEVSDEIPRLPPTLRCTHKPTACQSCLEQHISHAVVTNGQTVVSCPETECRHEMEYTDMKRNLANNKMCFERYETLLLRRALQDDSSFVWCKSPKCGAGQIHTNGDTEPIVICHSCRAKSCFKHDLPWHTGLTCAEYDAQRDRTAQDLASEEYISQNAKTCPNKKCGRRIQKIDGCDHMTCRRPAGCGHEFCWLCLADYNGIRNEGNHRHKRDCEYYRENGGGRVRIGIWGAFM